MLTPKLQAAAIPVRDGHVCLVSSRTRKRWVVPKGMIPAGLSLARAAELEAWEEAGVAGLLVPEPVGTYEYTKNGRAHCVTVFLLHVTSEADTWPEMHQRSRVWHPVERAAEQLVEPELRDIVRDVLALSAVEQR